MAKPQSDKVKEKTSFTEKKGSLGGTAVNHGEGNGTPLQYCLENPMDRGAWRATVHGIVELGTTE